MTEDAPAPRRFAAELGAAAGFFLVATAAATWPLPLRISSALPDLWDNKLTAWILHWDFHQTFRDPSRLFDANIFYPARYALAFSENLFGVALFGFPLYAAGVSTLAAQNVLLLLGMFLSAMAAWALARELTGDSAASWLAGIVYAFVPWRVSQLPHLQFQWGAFLALTLLFLLRFVERGRRRDLVFFAACVAWNALANVHFAIFSAFLIGVLAVLEWTSGGADSRRRGRALLGAAALAGIAVLPLYVPYVRAARLYGMERSFGEMRFFSGNLSDFLSAGSRNRLYGAATRRWAHPEGDFFPGLVPLALAVVAVVRLRQPRAAEEPAGERRKRPGLRGLDAAVGLLAALWIAALARPGLRIGSLRLGDPDRILFYAGALALIRLSIAFPARWRRKNLADWLRRARLERRALLVVAVAATGFVVALGAHTPVYAFLFQSAGPVFRAVRAPARGIVLFDLALGVLAAWGLSLATRSRRGPSRFAGIAAALALTAVEYRASPLELHAVAPEASAVHRWLAREGVPAGVVEWPLGNQYDFEYEFRSTAHWKPLVNGASGFFPTTYLALADDLRGPAIPDTVWDRLRSVRAALLVFHPHDAPPGILYGCADAVKRGLRDGRLELLVSLEHGRDRDFLFRLTSAPPFDAGVTPDERRSSAEAFAALTVRPGFDNSPPILALDAPSERATVKAGEWAYGWAADDSGIREVRFGTEAGPVGRAGYGGARPDVERVLSQFPDAAHLGFHFQVPVLSPGPHTLYVTAVGRDGGETTLRRKVVAR